MANMLKSVEKIKVPNTSWGVVDLLETAAGVVISNMIVEKYTGSNTIMSGAKKALGAGAVYYALRNMRNKHLNNVLLGVAVDGAVDAAYWLYNYARAKYGVKTSSNSTSAFVEI